MESPIILFRRMMAHGLTKTRHQRYDVNDKSLPSIKCQVDNISICVIKYRILYIYIYNYVRYIWNLWYTYHISSYFTTCFSLIFDNMAAGVRACPTWQWHFEVGTWAWRSWYRCVYCKPHGAVIYSYFSYRKYVSKYVKLLHNIYMYLLKRWIWLVHIFGS